ncbi:MAG TPA: phospholipase [Solirubrobacterales bacterium]|nr:phospholipase [Solirubrobacterales bacterium]
MTGLIARRREADGEPEGALVLLHGRGADENDLFPLLDYLDPERWFLGVTPRGPFWLPPGGAHWYAVREIGYPDPETFLASFAQAAELIDTLGFPPDRIVLGGFSQGAVMTYALGLGEGRPRPAAMLCFSGFIPTVEGFELDLSPPLPPIAIGHGTYDDVIGVEWGRKAHELFPHAAYRESPLPHTIDPRFLRELSGWIYENAAQTPSANARRNA